MQFQLYQVPIDSKSTIRQIKKQFKVSFTSLMESFTSVQDFSIGTTAPDYRMNGSKINGASFFVRNSFCGQIKKFFVLKKELNIQEIINITQTEKEHRPNSELIRELKSSSFKLFSSNKSDEIADYDQFVAQAFLNLDTFPNIHKMDASSRPEWISISNRRDRNSTSIIGTKSEIDRVRKNKIIDGTPEKFYDIQVRGMSYFEKGRFEDVFFSIGNIDMLFYAIELLYSFRSPSELKNCYQESREELLSSILEIIKFLCKSDNKKVVLLFLRNNGFQVLARLLQEVVLSVSSITSCLVCWKIWCHKKDLGTPCIVPREH